MINAILLYHSKFGTSSIALSVRWQALDHVIAEARRHGIRLILSLVNNLKAYGGKTQYVKWAWEEGVGLSSSNDSFFYDPSVRRYFKNYVKVNFYSSIWWNLTGVFINISVSCLSAFRPGKLRFLSY